jgi:hypothetical protein
MIILIFGSVLGSQKINVYSQPNKTVSVNATSPAESHIQKLSCVLSLVSCLLPFELFRGRNLCMLSALSSGSPKDGGKEIRTIFYSKPLTFYFIFHHFLRASIIMNENGVFNIKNRYSCSFC